MDGPESRGEQTSAAPAEPSTYERVVAAYPPFDELVAGAENAAQQLEAQRVPQMPRTR